MYVCMYVCVYVCMYVCIHSVHTAHTTELESRKGEQLADNFTLVQLEL